MKPERWRFIDSGGRPGGENMALDEALLESHAGRESPPTLRVYAWRPPAISVGRFQQVESSVDLAACGRMGIDVARRPTGGRAILHTEEEVTFSVVISAARLGASGVMSAYRALAGGIIEALHCLGLDARLVERSTRAGASSEPQDPACFAVKARCDLVVGSSKLVGSAQVQRNGFVLQQNSLPLRIRHEDWQQVFRRSPGAPEAVGLCDAAKKEIGYREVAGALREGFARTFEVEFEDGRPHDRELERARELLPKASISIARRGVRGPRNKAFGQLRPAKR